MVYVDTAIAALPPRGHLDMIKIEKAPLSSMDSDLEAFSHNPTDDSFAPLACQPRAKTNYPNQRFLSY